jgi:SAM-dependent methyltransferase
MATTASASRVHPSPSNPLLVKLVVGLMKASPHHPATAPLAVYYTKRFVESFKEGLSPASQYEYDTAPNFYRLFDGRLSPSDLAGRDVLDLACAYGGKTVYHARHGNVRSIVGLETSARKVRIAAQGAERLFPGGNVTFRIGQGEALPFDDGAFDVILADGAFEHVQDLPRVIGECYRVLRPGGRLYALFPPYYGPLAHHLCFVTNVPFLHHVFPPAAICDAVNQMLAERPEIGTNPWPAPQRSYEGREVLPRLNGTTERGFRRILDASAFRAVDVELVPFAWSPGGRFKRSVHTVCKRLVRLPWPFTRDVFTSLIRCVLERPRPGRPT